MKTSLGMAITVEVVRSILYRSWCLFRKFINTIRRAPGPPSPFRIIFLDDLWNKARCNLGKSVGCGASLAVPFLASPLLKTLLRLLDLNKVETFCRVSPRGPKSMRNAVMDNFIDDASTFCFRNSVIRFLFTNEPLFSIFNNMKIFNKPFIVEIFNKIMEIRPKYLPNLYKLENKLPFAIPNASVSIRPAMFKTD